MEIVKILNFLVLIGPIKTETEQNEIGFSDFLGGSNNGLETITPLGVLKEIYTSASKNPSLVTFLHLSFSELWHNTQLWASLNSSNTYMVKPRSDGLSLEITSALKNAPSIQNAPNIQTLMNNKDTLLNSIFPKVTFNT